MGVFTISDEKPKVATRLKVTEPDIDDTLVPIWIDLEKPLKISNADIGGNDPYNRNNY